LIIAISFWCISLFIIMECPSLYCLINVCLKSTLCEISIAYPCLFWGTFGFVYILLVFHFQPVLISVSELGLL
jgi:hypothetical protein